MKYEDADRTSTAELGMLIFLCSEIIFFGGMFLGYSVYRNWYPAAFLAGSRKEDLFLGATNTLVLITSSLFMAYAVDAGKKNKRKAVLVLLSIVGLLGLVFLGIKAREYTLKFYEHLYPGLPFLPGENAPRGMQIFYSYYFVMTGLHALHLIAGILVLGWLIFAVKRVKEMRDIALNLDIFGLYWHFVDIIWVFLFPLFYLIGRYH